MTTKQIGRRIELILAYEPSWFAEISSAVGIFLWGLFCFLTDDYTIRGWNWLLPSAALVFGPLRARMLLRLWPVPRVTLAMAGFVLWGWLCFAMFRRFGYVPMLGPTIALCVADVLTCGKFSFLVLTAWRDASDD